MHDNPDKQTRTDIVQTEYKSMQKQIPVDARFSGPVQTGPGPTQPSMKWVMGLFLGVKERVELYLFRLWAFMACYGVNFTFTFYLLFYIFRH
jgi:hypothetical protein